jgi:hypothetical protein
MRLDEVSKSRPTTPRAEIAASGSEKRLRRAETRADRSNPGPAGGDAMAEAFRRAGLIGKTQGGNKRSGPSRPPTPGKTRVVCVTHGICGTAGREEDPGETWTRNRGDYTIARSELVAEGADLRVQVLSLAAGQCGRFHPPGNPILRRDTRGRELSPRPYQAKQPLRRHRQLENLGTERYERIGKGVGKVIGPR